MSEEPINQRDLVHIQNALARIETLQSITNGRITVLERNNIYMRGFLAALGLLVGLPAIVGTILGVFIMVKGL